MRNNDTQQRSIGVIIPAYNEGGRIGEVLEVVCEIDWIDEIVVVDDGSTDRTAEKAKEHPVKVIEFPENKGKGAALEAGTKKIAADLIAFIDADLIGLREDHIGTLIDPLIADDDLMMTVGRFTGGRLSTNLSQMIAPILNGQRGLKRSFLDVLPDLSDYRFGVEIFISRYAANRSLKTAEVILEGLSQVLKEEKNGIFKGTIERYKMYGQLLKTLRYAGKKRGGGLHS